LALGSIIGTDVFNRVSTKWILIVTLIPNAIALWGVTLTNNFWLLSACRFMTGFTQVFVGIFIPVWADKFAPTESAKQCWITGVLMASTVGVLIGYVITATLISWDRWHWSFYVQALAIIPVEMLLLMTPERYLSIRDNISEDGGPKLSFKNRINILMNNKSFIFLTLSLSGLYFIITGIQYWMSQYLEVVMAVEP